MVADVEAEVAVVESLTVLDTEVVVMDAFVGGEDVMVERVVAVGVADEDAVVNEADKIDDFEDVVAMVELTEVEDMVAMVEFTDIEDVIVMVELMGAEDVVAIVELMGFEGVVAMDVAEELAILLLLTSAVEVVPFDDVAATSCATYW